MIQKYTNTLHTYKYVRSLMQIHYNCIWDSCRQNTVMVKEQQSSTYRLLFRILVRELALISACKVFPLPCIFLVSGSRMPGCFLFLQHQGRQVQALIHKSQELFGSIVQLLRIFPENSNRLIQNNLDSQARLAFINNTTTLHQS